MLQISENGKKFSFCCFLFLLAFPIVGFCQKEESEGTSLLESYSLPREIFHIVCMLLLILGILFLFSWITRKFFHKRLSLFNRQNIIQVVAQRSLSAKATLFVIEVEGKRILLGESSSGLITLAPLDEDN